MNEKEKAISLVVKLDQDAEKLNRTYQEFLQDVIRRIKL